MRFISFFVCASATTLLATTIPLFAQGSLQQPTSAKSSLRSRRETLYLEIIGTADTGQLARVRRLLDEGVPVNARFDNANHDTPLTLAAGFGHPDAVRLLLARGADPDARDDDGQTALWKAAQAPLSEAGDFMASGPVPPTPAQRRAWTAAYVSIIRSLFKHGARPDIPDLNGMTPLGVAAFENRQAEVAALLEGRANPNRRDRFGKTPLEWAAYNGNLAVARLLQQHGARPGTGHTLPQPGQREKDVALLLAIEQSDIVGVKTWLARKADPNAVTYTNSYEDPELALSNVSTPLAATDSPLVTRLLLRAGANPNGINWRGKTPIMGASAQVTALLLARKANVNAHDNDGQTPLMNAASDAGKTRLLLLHGANVRARDTQGATALTKCDNETVLGLLLSHGASINEADNAGVTALMNAAEQSYGEGGVTCDAPWARTLLHHGADPNRRNRNGRTALMILSAPFDQPTSDADYYDPAARLSFARMLLAHAARRELRDNQGRTALQIARQSGARQLARLLRPASSNSKK